MTRTSLQKKLRRQLSDMITTDYNFDDYASLCQQYEHAMSLCQLSSMQINDLDDRLANALDYCAIVKSELSFQQISGFFDPEFVSYCNNMLSILHNDIAHHDTVILYYYAKLKLLICRTASMFELILDPTRKFKTYIQVCQLSTKECHDKFIDLIGFNQCVRNNDIELAMSKISSLASGISHIVFPVIKQPHILDQNCILAELTYRYFKNAQFPNFLRYCITDKNLYVKNNILDVDVMKCILQKPNLIAIGRQYSALIDMNCTLYSFTVFQSLQIDVAALYFDIYKHDSHLYYTKNAKIVNDKSIERQLDDFNSIAPSLLKIVKSSDISFLD